MSADASRGPGTRRRARPRASGLYRCLDHFVIRTPILPVTDYPAAEDLRRAPATARVRDDEHARRAVVVSSLPLATSLLGPARTERDRRRLESSILRYLIRLSTRPTPFGLNAGVALGRWGPVTDVRLADRPPDVHARVDMHALMHFVTALESRTEIREATTVIANPAVLHRAGRITLSGVEAVLGANGGENVTLRATGAVTRALALTRTPMAYSDLAADLLEAVPGATPDKVHDLLYRLWRHAFLLTDLRPPLTHLDPAGHVLDHLGRIPAAGTAAADLGELLAAIRDWERQPAGAGAAAFPALADHARRVTGFGTATPLQVDTVLPLAACDVSRKVADEAVRAAELLLRLTPFPFGLPQISAYRSAFEVRYGTDREVPVLELLDPVTGLGSPSLLPPVLPAKAARSETLLRLATGALHDHLDGIDLDQDTIDRLAFWEADPERLPTSLDLYAMVSAASPAAVDAGDFHLVVGPNVGAGAAGRNLGRFAGMLTGAVPALGAIADAEQSVEAGRILAELVYLPEKTRSANVVVRPAIRDHEVGIRTSAEDGPARSIPLDQLAVRVTNGRFVLVWDDGTGELREVSVCSGHMLNNSRAPAVCRFLAEVSRDGTAQIVGFDWGPARDFPYLPRVASDRVVLRLAQWRIDHATAHEMAGPPDRFPAAFDAWRRRWRVPRYTYLTSSDAAADHRLLIDSTAHAHTNEIRRALTRLRPGGSVVLQEALPGLADAWVSGPNGRHTVELVVSMTRNTPVPPSVPPGKAGARVARADRLRPPGSDWTYVKLYGDRQEEESLLVDGIREVVRSLDRHCDRRFFLRYGDPEPHLRLRLRGNPSVLVPALSDWAGGLLADGHVSRFTFDVYDREIERYGGLIGMDVTEQLYSADSSAVLDLLSLDHAGQSQLDRTGLALLTIDDLLTGLGLSEAERVRFYHRETPQRRLAGAEYRTRKAEFCDLLRSPPPRPIGDVLSRRRPHLADVADRLADLKRRRQLGKTLPELCHSYVHLHCNRLLGTDRAAENTALELLYRTRHSITSGA
ncbi:lantibiotic dehydratase [Streptomyces sp. RerS4]|uniref:lantibiotic dehydratase n=1 Tax=Streptomyces sp. RerS4 TaxID=2942449 RepID=UPI00201B9C3E|nr:lantibiotic dehydratase [Streptomyces sp. RerS4]UQX04767.1 lantibiotic dehydratase [Streptomyces sp. RerS4]